MSLEVWLKRSEKITIGGRELYMMPLPLTRLYGIGTWLEENAGDVVKETISSSADQQEVPNPIVLISRVLSRVDVSEVALYIFSTPKDPETRQPLNKDLSKEFFDDYLDLPTAQEVYEKFIRINDVEKLIKNLQSLPVVRKLMEASSLAFGIPFLNSLRPNTDSTQSKLEGSPSPKSTDTLTPATTEKLESGSPTKTPNIVVSERPERLM